MRPQRNAKLRPRLNIFYGPNLDNHSILWFSIVAKFPIKATLVFLAFATSQNRRFCDAGNVCCWRFPAERFIRCWPLADIDSPVTKGQLRASLRPERPVESLPKSRRSPEASFPTRATRLCWKAIRRAAPTAPAMRPPSPVVLPQAPPWTDRLRGNSAVSSRPGPRRSRS